MPTSADTTVAIPRLEQLHTMLNLDEAVEILTGKRPSRASRVRKRAVNLWRDLSLLVSAPFRKAVDVIEGRLMFPVEELELYLRRCRRVGFIKELVLEVPYYEFGDGEIRLISADLVAALKGEAPLEFPDCIQELCKGLARFQNNQVAAKR